MITFTTVFYVLIFMLYWYWLFYFCWSVIGCWLYTPKFSCRCTNLIGSFICLFPPNSNLLLIEVGLIPFEFKILVSYQLIFVCLIWSFRFWTISTFLIHAPSWKLTLRIFCDGVSDRCKSVIPLWVGFSCMSANRNFLCLHFFFLFVAFAGFLALNLQWLIRQVFMVLILVSYFNKLRRKDKNTHSYWKFWELTVKKLVHSFFLWWNVKCIILNHMKLMNFFPVFKYFCCLCFHSVALHRRIISKV